MFDISKICGKVIKGVDVIGSGFLINSKYFITARHNLLEPREVPDEEREVFIRFELYGDINGRTINLKEAYDNDVDCVIVELELEVFDIEFTKAISVKNNLKDFKFKTYGYPKEKIDGIYIQGVVSSNEKEIDRNIDYTMTIKKNDILQSYKGLSGSPLVVDNLIVGIIIQQGSSENLFAISFKIIDELFKDMTKIYNIEEKELQLSTNRFISEIRDLDIEIFKKHLEEAIRIAGPRYTKKLNLDTETSRNLLFFIKDNINLNDLEDIIWGLEDHISKLEKCTNEDTYSKAIKFSGWAREKIISVINRLRDVVQNCNDIIKTINYQESITYIDEINNTIFSIKKDLENIFKEELIKFENKYGKGRYQDKKWRGYMASYMCIFPCENLDNIKRIKEYLDKFENFFRINPIKLITSKNMLLHGDGGSGKTHCLCDLTYNNIKNGIPSLLFYGQEFINKSPEEIILERLSIDDITFDYLLYKLNLIGEIKDKIILICIDGINETEDKTYWNRNLIRLTEKINQYNNLKFIVSCRNIYISEVLEQEISDRLLKIGTTGFQGIEQVALSKFFEYYNIEIPFQSKMEKEYSNPLFLKLYCETLKDSREESMFDIDGLTDLIERFLNIKNDKISKKLSNYISPRDKVVFECVESIALYMDDKNTNYIEWRHLRKNIKDTLDELLEESNGMSKTIIDELISENILKENDTNSDSMSFAFERFFDYLLAKNIINSYTEINLKIKISKLIDNISIYKGVLEILIILYKEKYKKELIFDLDIKGGILYNLTLSGLSWRKNSCIDRDTLKIVEICLYNREHKELNETAFFSILHLSLKKDCILNANYFNYILKNTENSKRDLFLSKIMLKSYTKYEIINKLIENTKYLTCCNMDRDIIILWQLVLVWFTSLNDIYIRDLASKSLTNLFRLYPDTILDIVEKFKNIDDEYIKERLWQAVYSALILTRDKEILISIVKKIYIEFIQKNKLPSNVLLRDILRNIAEFARELSVLEYDILYFRPPYKSDSIVKIHDKKLKDLKEKYKDLYFNCTESDFATYTIPSEVENYGFTKTEVGNLIFKEILELGYSEETRDLDTYIDQTYGSLRNRDETIERIGKKYQKIVLKKILGQIYDNYKYTPKYKWDEQLSLNQQGNQFREIDLTCIIGEGLNRQFDGNKFIYNFNYIKNLSYKDWFEKHDLEDRVNKLIEFEHEKEEYFLLEGYFNSNEPHTRRERYPLKDVWLQVRSYLLRKEDLDKFKNWVSNKNFMGRWMPEGGEFYEGCMGEYPWGISYKTYLEADDDTYDGRHNKLPVKLIPTINRFNNEKDSPNCATKLSDKFLFPSIEFFRDIELIWNGGNYYTYNSKEMFFICMGEEKSIYVNRSMIKEYLNKKGLVLVWTALGEKQVITGSLSNKFVGNAELSESYVYQGEGIEKIYTLYEINE